MHGIFRFFDQTMSDEALEDEGRILKERFKDILKSNSYNPADLPKVSDDLARFMAAPMEEFGEKSSPDNQNLATGYTYLGQLMAHDISVHRFLGDVPPALRLRTLYGLGPGMTPYLYDYKPLQEVGLQVGGAKMTLEHYTTDFGQKVYDIQRYKLTPDKQMPERQHSIPLMADSRNDQNFIISQLLVSFMRIHNFIVDAYATPGHEEAPGMLFQKASKALIGLYQAVLIYDYLPRILYDPGLISHLRDKDNFIFFHPKEEARLSEIFSRAAFRFGHSQVRQFYSTIPNREVQQLFGNGNDLRGFVRDTRRAIDWKVFFGTRPDGMPVQSAKAFDHLITLPMSSVPFLRKNDKSVVSINLRQSMKNFPGGKDFFNGFFDAFKNMRSHFSSVEKKTMLDENYKSLLAKVDEKLKPSGLTASDCPLWLFFLLEAEIMGNGQKLGPLCSRIIAEQVMWIMLHDKESIINKPANFPKDLFPEGAKKITMYDLVKWVEPPAIPQNIVETIAKKEAVMATETTTPPANEPVIYKGTEFKQVSDLAPYTDPVSTLIGRTQIINNGFHDTVTSRTEDYEALIRDGLYQEPGGKVKQQIRMYVSRRSILYQLGFKSSDTIWDAAADVKGIIFIFGLSPGAYGNAQIQLVARPVNEHGRALEHHDVMYFSDTKRLVWADGTTKDEQLTDVPFESSARENMARLVGTFIKDNFSVLKSSGIEKPIEIQRSVLLTLLGIAPGTVGAKQVEHVKFQLAAASGREIMDVHELTLPEGGLNEIVPNTLFFTLAALSKTNDNSQILMSDIARPYPYWCYDG